MEVINKNLGNACLWRACSTKLTRLFKGAPDHDLDDEIDGSQAEAGSHRDHRPPRPQHTNLFGCAPTVTCRPG